MSKDLPHLPPEVITIILTKLPVQSLLKFKSVSKSWLSLISTPQFAKLQLQQMKQSNTATPRIFMTSFQSFNPEPNSDDDYTLMEHVPINNVAMDFPLVGSVDGLICATVDFRYAQLVVFNPTTNQVREIPPPDFIDKGRYFCGFGYDSKIDGYKIVRGVIFSLFCDGFCIEVFNLKGNSWRTIQTKHWCGDYSFDEEGVLLGYLFEGGGVFLNGILHWLSRKNKFSRKNKEIFRFDLIEEKFLDAMPFPSQTKFLDAMPFRSQTNRLSNLIVIDECLCLYDLGFDTFLYVTKNSLVKMMNYGDHNSWKIVHEISTTMIPEECNGFLYVTKNGHLLFDIERDYMILYNPEDEETKQIGYEAEDCVMEKCKTVYIQSLVSPNIAD